MEVSADKRTKPVKARSALENGERFVTGPSVDSHFFICEIQFLFKANLLSDRIHEYEI